MDHHHRHELQGCACGEVVNYRAAEHSIAGDGHEPVPAPLDRLLAPLEGASRRCADPDYTRTPDVAARCPGAMSGLESKLEFPAANNGMRIPLSLTISNRTELIKESEVRGQIGISFNLDSLFASN